MMENQANSQNASYVAGQFKLASSLYRARRYREAYAVYQALANDGVVWAYVVLGGMHRDGRGVPTDFDIALGWLKKAIAAGSVEAMFHAGRIPTEENRHSEALPLYEAAARRDYSPAIYRLGRVYAKGQGVPVDGKLAIEYFRRAAGMGHLFAKRELIVRDLKARGLFDRLRALAAFCRLAWDIVRTEVRDRYSINVKG